MEAQKPNLLTHYIPNTLFNLSGQTAVVVGAGGLYFYDYTNPDNITERGMIAVAE